jgi:GNAT superfamily N-acetyltransferase
MTSGAAGPIAVRVCRVDEVDAIHEIINDGAEAYRGKIPGDCWHEPYMSRDELESELTKGVSFHGCDEGGHLIGVMGIQNVRGVDLIRHAYVRPEHQGFGVGGRLLGELLESTDRPVLVGTWRAATWAIAFYQRHGFELVRGAARSALLGAYWSVSERQCEVSVVLSAPEPQADVAPVATDAARDAIAGVPG